MPKTIGSITASLIAAQLAVVALATPGRAAGAADDCLAGPNATAPKGSHWYYRVDRATRRQCWYVGPEGKAVHRAERSAEPVPSRDADGDAGANPPTNATSRVEAAAVPPVPAMPGGQTVPDGRDGAAPSQSAGFGQRWIDLPAAANAPATTAPSQSIGMAARDSDSPDQPAVRPPVPSSGIEVDTPAPSVAPADRAAPSGGVSVLMLILVAIGLGGVGVLVRAAFRVLVARRPKIHVERRSRRRSIDWTTERTREPVAPTYEPALAPRRSGDLARFPVELIALREAEEDLARLLRAGPRRAA